MNDPEESYSVGSTEDKCYFALLRKGQGASHDAEDQDAKDDDMPSHAEHCDDDFDDIRLASSGSGRRGHDKKDDDHDNCGSIPVSTSVSKPCEAKRSSQVREPVKRNVWTRVVRFLRRRKK